jgi:hypothetical protein
VGVGIRLVLIWWLAEVFESQLRGFVNWTNQYQMWIILVSVALVVLANVRNFRRGR